MPPAGRREAESHLLVASVFLAARAHLVDAILDPSSFVGREQVALIGVLAERTMSELAAVVPAGSPFWELHRSIVEDDVDDLLEDADRRRSHATADDPTTLLRSAWSGPAQVLAHAAMASDPAAISDRPGIDREVVAMLDGLAEAVQVRDDLARMQRDLAEERASFPIAVAARAAGLSLQPWPSPAVVLGAMVATGSLATILEAANGRLQASRKIAVGAGLPTFATYLGDVIAALDERGRSRTMGPVPANAIRERSERTPVGDRPAAGTGRSHANGRAQTALFAPAEPALPKAIAMAEGFLRADGALRESWEMHREGMFGPGDVWSRYPEGLVLEILHGHGHDVTQQIDDLLSFTVANGFRYFAHPWSAVDSDTVGVFLRLLPFATPDDRYREALEPVLARLDEQVRAEGGIPVWIAGDAETTADRPPAMDLGEGCGTVAAHLLLGLLGLSGPLGDGWTDHRKTVSRGAAALLDRIATVGLGANVDYPPLYALARFEQLIGRLSDSPAGEGLTGQATAARTELAGALDRACARGPRSAQEAAMLTIACLEAGRAQMHRPGMADHDAQEPGIRWRLERRGVRRGSQPRQVGDLVLELDPHDCPVLRRAASHDLPSPARPRSGAARNEGSPSSVRVLMDDAVRLATLASYVPRSVQHDIIDHGTARESAHVEPSQGALLLVDISGFTGLTADAVRRGPAGIEGLSRSLNVQLGSIIDLIAEHGGDIDKIVGDGLLPVWRATDEDLATTARRAASCGLAILAQVGGLALDGRRAPAAQHRPVRGRGLGDARGRRRGTMAAPGRRRRAIPARGTRGVDAQRGPGRLSPGMGAHRRRVQRRNPRRRLHAGRRRPVPDRAAPGDARGPGRR